MRMIDEMSATSDDRFHGVFQKLHIGMLIQGPGAEILFSNQAALDLLGLTADQLIGKTSYDANWNVIREDGTPFPSESHPVPAAIATRQSVRNVVMGVYRPKTADRVWLLVNAEPQLAPDGGVRQVVCTFSDITAYRRWEDAQRRLAEDALRKQNQELSALHDTTLDLIDHDDPHSLLEAIVSRAGALLGTADGYLYTVEPAESEPSEQELVARICTGVFTDYKNYRQRPGEGLTGRVLASGQSLVVDDYSTWAGRKFVFNWLHAVAATPLRSGAKIVGVLGLAYMEPGRAFIASEIAQLERFAHLASIVLDNARLYAAAQQELAERKRVEEERIALERQLLEAQKMESLGALAGGMAHDFNNLLQIIVGNAGLARTELFDPARIQTSLSRIEQAAQQAADLTRQLLAYAGKGRYLIQPLDLDAILSTTLQHVQPSLPASVALRYRAGAPLPAILADETQIQQIVMNLVMNAAEAIGAAGTISVTADRQRMSQAELAATQLGLDLPEGEYVFLEVADDGSGMDGATQARIFEPFFTTKFTGRGLGMAAVLGSVRSHRGALCVWSAPGQGTRVRVWLPALVEGAATGSGSPAQEQPAPRYAPQLAANRRLPLATILVIDDEDGVRTVTARLLERASYSVLTAPDGRRGIATFQLHAESIACVLLDLTMPQSSGEQVFHELRRIAPDVPILLMSGYSEQEATGRFAGLGLAGFLHKPFTPADLRDTIERALTPRG